MVRALVIANLLTIMPQELWGRPVAVVMLDPGHGGTNKGAFGRPIDVYEKKLTLDVAQRTARFLRQWRPDMRVELTRTRDRYLTLNQRVRRANESGAAVFVSIHFNASESRSQRGFETFILNAAASRTEANRLKMQRVQKNRNVVDAIVSDLQFSASHGEAARLARAIQDHLVHVRGKDGDRGVRQAAFDVLRGLRMPGVLVEAGFIDHIHESPPLKQPATLESIAAAIAAAISDYLPLQYASARPLPDN